MKKYKTDLSVTNNVGIRVKANILVGENGVYESGTLLDANAILELINSKMNGGSTSLPTQEEPTNDDIFAEDEDINNLFGKY